jgi:hypothetical protein
MSDHEHNGFEVPDIVAAELRAKGYVSRSSAEVSAHEVTFLALTVRHYGKSSVVFLLQLPGVIPALAQALVTWFDGSALDERLELVVRRGGGAGSFRSDSAPSVDGVAAFLREGVWGHGGPPDGRAGDMADCVRRR